MSDIDLNSMDPLRDLIDDRGYDSWQRTSYSRDCDIGSYRLPDTSGNKPEWSRGHFSLGWIVTKQLIKNPNQFINSLLYFCV